MPVQAFLVADDGNSESITLELEREEGSSVYGNTSYYSFSSPVHQDKAYTALEIKQEGNSTLASFPLQSDIFVVPSKTSMEGSKVTFTVAIRTAGEPSSPSSSSPPEITISAPSRQQGTLAPKSIRYKADVRPATTIAASGYQFWEGSVDLDAPTTGAVAVLAAGTAEGGEVHDVLYLSAGVAGW